MNSSSVTKKLLPISVAVALMAVVAYFLLRGAPVEDIPGAALSGLGGLWKTSGDVGAGAGTGEEPPRDGVSHDARAAGEVPPAVEPNEAQQEAAASSAPELASWNVYENFEYGFLFRHPASMRITEFAESGGDMVVLESSGSESMQIFIVPWDEGGEMMTPARIRRDLPDLVIRNPQVIELEGGGRALIFEGAKDGVGATREVWIIAGGFLYQIAAPIAFDRELSWVMATWRFE